MKKVYIVVFPGNLFLRLGTVDNLKTVRNKNRILDLLRKVVKGISQTMVQLKKLHTEENGHELDHIFEHKIYTFYIHL